MSWIEQKIQEVATLNETFHAQFSRLGAEQMDFKPDAKTWSINECLDHIIQSNQHYDDIFAAIAQGQYKSGIGVPILSRLLGRLLVKTLSPDFKGKFKTASQLYPRNSTYEKNITQELLDANKVLIEHLRQCDGVDLDAVIVRSPINGLVRYSLRDCIAMLVDHEKRHLNQALRLKSQIEQAVRSEAAE